MSAAIISWIRSVVPIGVGAAISWLLTLGIELDADAQAGLIVGLTGVLIAGYYSLARLLEKKWPVFGVLLGVAKTPDSYSKGDAPKPESVTPSIVTLNASPETLEQFQTRMQEPLPEPTYPPFAADANTPIYNAVQREHGA